jgi:hypothetical protein
LAILAWAVALWRLRSAALPASSILLVATLLRLLALPLPPSLSDDVYRYVWDGQVTRAGYNPYTVAPDDERLADLRDSRWQSVAHRDVETVYPPLALALFSIASALPRPVLALKTLLTLIDLSACLLLVRLARARGVPTGRTTAYAWSPLVVVEVAGMGHVDALVVAPVLGGLLLLGAAGPRSGDRGAGVRESALAGAGVALGGLAKLFPLLLLPAWTRIARRPKALIGACLVTTVLGFAYFLPGLSGVPPGLARYAVSWEFNGPIFEPLWRLLEVAKVDEGLHRLVNQASGLFGSASPWDSLHRWIYPQLIAKAILGGALLAVVLASSRWRDPVVATLRVFGAVILCSATVYPWYLLGVLAVAAVLGRASWWVLAGTAPFSYLSRLAGIPLLPWIYLLVWAPPLLATVWARRRTA